MPPKPPKSPIKVCQFCRSIETPTNPLVEFENDWICVDCIRSQQEMSEALFTHLRDECKRQTGIEIAPPKGRQPAPALEEKKAAAAKKKAAAKKLPSPREMKSFLDQYVVGQDETKRILSVAVHNHYKRVLEDVGEDEDGVELEKSNILLLGPTGSGKTLIARTLARMLDVPFAIADATTITEAGYVGEDVENILLALIRAADMDVEKAQKGIIFVDEIDKVARKTGNVSITRDVSGEGVQQALLKILEGTEAHVPPMGGRKHPEQRYIDIQTKNILFICGGAFVGMDKIIERRTASGHFGFTATDSATTQKKQSRRPEPEDFIEFGLIPEFIGRLPVVAALDELTEEDLIRILKEPKNSLIKQYEKLFKLEKISLSFDEDALRAIAHEAVVRKTGARGLRAILENLMTDTLFEAIPDSTKPAPASKLKVTADMVRAQLDGSGKIHSALKPARS